MEKYDAQIYIQKEKVSFTAHMDRITFFTYIGGINRYMLLDRMRSDCTYWLGNGNRHNPHLWAGNPVDQIQYMKWLWESFPSAGKPEWLTMEQIDALDEHMNGWKT